MTQLHRTGKRDIVLWKLFRQTFYCHPESGGSHDTGYTLVMGTHSLIISCQVTRASGADLSHRGRNVRNVTLRQAAAVMITIHSLPALQRYSVTALQYCTPPHNPTQPWPWQWHWSRDSCLTCAMCQLTVCPHRQQVNTLYTPSSLSCTGHWEPGSEGIALRVQTNICITNGYIKLLITILNAEMRTSYPFLLEKSCSYW